MLRAGELHRMSQLALFSAAETSSSDADKKTNALPLQVKDFTAKKRASKEQLWLCVHFPRLSLDALGCSHRSKAAVFSELHGRPHVTACTGQAQQSGVVTGMSLNAALALVADLELRQRREDAEQDLLRAHAEWALNYTPLVSIDEQGSLLLEVGGSLRLFGGIRALRERLAAELAFGGYDVVLASAPTARAALWLSHAGQQVDCVSTTDLPDMLASLPLACVGWPLKLQKILLRMGVTTLGECRRLPRDGFARRLGATFLRELDQGFGLEVDIRQHYQVPTVFDETLDLADEVSATTELLGGVQILLASLGEHLGSQQVSVQHLAIELAHYGREASLLEVPLREPGRAVEYLQELVQLQFDRLCLPAPVTGLRLQATTLPFYQPAATDLFAAEAGLPRSLPAAPARSADQGRLVERLQARLGAQRVHGMQQVAEHRPERAWRIAEMLAPAGGGRSAVPGQLVSRPRPLWLLAAPQRLRFHGGAPWRRGALQLQADAERIDSGWWDGSDVQRDYYRAVDTDGSRCWVYRDRQSSTWYLHGLFA